MAFSLGVTLKGAGPLVPKGMHTIPMVRRSRALNCAKPFSSLPCLDLNGKSDPYCKCGLAAADGTWKGEPSETPVRRPFFTSDAFLPILFSL